MSIKKNTFLIFLLSFLTITTTKAKIIDASDISVIREEAEKLTKDDLISFDVKGVLFTPQDLLLSPHFKEKYRNYFSKIRSEKGQNEAKRLNSIVLLTYKPKLVDEGMPALIKDIQDRKIKVISITSGKVGEYGSIKSREDIRIDTLKALGIDFSNSFEQTKIILETLDETPVTLFKNGVLFTSNALKGDKLKLFLEKVRFIPRKLIHVDNSIRMLNNLQDYCEKNGIEFLGIHFTKIYKNYTDTFNIPVADKQIDVLVNKSQWVSDQTAQCMIDTGLNIKQCE